MEINDMLIGHHIVTDGELTQEQADTIVEILETSDVFQQVVEYLMDNNHTILHSHSNNLHVETKKVTIVNEHSEEFSISEYIAREFYKAVQENHEKHHTDHNNDNEDFDPSFYT